MLFDFARYIVLGCWSTRYALAKIFCSCVCVFIVGVVICCLRVWGAIYAAAECDSQQLVLDTTVPYGDCIGGVLPDGTAVCVHFNSII